jgi:hypothetical protein
MKGIDHLIIRMTTGGSFTPPGKQIAFKCEGRNHELFRKIVDNTAFIRAISAINSLE